MVGYYPLCAFGENRVAASIDTPLHAFLPFPHVDHLHPDWAIALAASANGEQKLDEFNQKYGRRIVWVPWQRPGFELALMLRKAVDATPGCDGIVLGGHGLFTWGETQHECYLNSIKTIDQMGEFIHDHAKRAGRPLFGGASATTAAGREALVDGILPYLRGAVSSNRRVVAHYDGGRGRDGVRERDVGGVALPDGHELSRSLPAHAHLAAVRAVGRREPMGSPALKTRIAERLVQYRQDYAAYYKAHALPDSPALRDSNPSVVVIPGLGLFGFGKDKREARITSEFFVNAIHVMAGANALGAASGDQARRPAAGPACRAGGRFQELPELRRAAAIGGVPDRILGARGSQAPADAARARVQPQDRRRRRRRERHRPRSGAADREARRARRGRRHERRERRGGRERGGGAFVEGDGPGGGARPDVAREHRGRVPRDGRPLRRHRRRRQHRGDLSDAGARHAARRDLGEGDARQRHEQPRAGGRGREDPQGAGAGRRRSS